LKRQSIDSVSIALEKERQANEELHKFYTESKAAEQVEAELSEKQVYDIMEQASNPPTEYDQPQESGNLGNVSVTQTS
jgi:hypothetical protein